MFLPIQVWNAQLSRIWGAPTALRPLPSGGCKTQGPQDFVPVCEVGSEVAIKLWVMQVVVRHATVPAKRHQSVGRPREVIAGVVLHRQPDVDHVKDQHGERVAPEQRDIRYVKEAQGKQLPDAHVLRGQREGGRVAVVHLVEGAVQPGHLVVQHVPREKLGVEEQQAEHDVTHQLEQLGGLEG